MPFSERMARVIDQLTAEGYVAQFRGDEEGLRAVRGGVFSASEFVVEKMARFEGTSDPDDECIVFALLAPDGTRGTWAVTYGPEGRDALEQEALRRLVISEPPFMV